MSDEARLQRWLAAQRASGTDPATNHADMETLVRHAAGQLDPLATAAVHAHVLVCADGRCGAFVRVQQGTPSADGLQERSFRSRDALWGLFESMATVLGAPVDHLVNEAMLTHARVQGWGGLGSGPRPDSLAETHEAPVISPLDLSYAPGPKPPDFDDDLAQTSSRAAFPRLRPESAPTATAIGQPSAAALTPPYLDPLPPKPVPIIEPGPDSRTTPRHGIMAARGGTMPLPPPAAERSSRARGVAGPPPLPGRVGTPPSSTKRLVLEYGGRAHEVDKDRYLLGRSNTQADLRLEDPNVSRQHAVIERVGAAWYVVDLGSTNGVHVAGERVVRRALSDGDVITIITHEIRCLLK
jgi:hypothetical protein